MRNLPLPDPALARSTAGPPTTAARARSRVRRWRDRNGKISYDVNQFSGSGGYTSSSTSSLAVANLAAEILVLQNGSEWIPRVECDQDQEVGSTTSFSPDDAFDFDFVEPDDDATLDLNDVAMDETETKHETPQIGDVPPKTFQGDLADLPIALASMKKERRWVLWRWKFQGFDKDGEEKWTRSS